jgi:hypothetical protein
MRYSNLMIFYLLARQTALTTILLDYRHMHHDLVCIKNEAKNFYEVSDDIIMAKFDDSCKRNAVTFDDLLESLVDVDAYRTLLVIKNLFIFQKNLEFVRRCNTVNNPSKI